MTLTHSGQILQLLILILQTIKTSELFNRSGESVWTLTSCVSSSNTVDLRGAGGVKKERQLCNVSLVFVSLILDNLSMHEL